MAMFSGWWSRDVGGEAELPEERVEEAASFFVVRRGELEDDWNVRFYVHGLEHRGGRGGCSGSIGIAVDRRGIGGKRGGLGIRRIEAEERVVVHGGHGDGGARRGRAMVRDGEGGWRERKEINPY
jgi:hypothetical protein